MVVAILNFMGNIAAANIALPLLVALLAMGWIWLVL